MITEPDISGAVFYSVVMKEDGKEESVVKNSTQTEVTFDNLTPGRWFEFYLLTVGVEGQINTERSGVIRIQTVPATPKNLRSVEVSTSSVSLTWDAVTGNLLLLRQMWPYEGQIYFCNAFLRRQVGSSHFWKRNKVKSCVKVDSSQVKSIHEKLTRVKPWLQSSQAYESLLESSQGKSWKLTRVKSCQVKS